MAPTDAMIPHFYYHPRMLAYDFGPGHPLKPERLRRAVELLEALFADEGLAKGRAAKRGGASKRGGIAGRRRESAAPGFDAHTQACRFRVDPGTGQREHALRVHAEEYVRAVEVLSSGVAVPQGFASTFGFGPGDNPPFVGMYDASLAYLAGTVAASQRVLEGAPVAINLSGGLHHALRDRASGFCIFNDPAVAIHVLLEGQMSPPGPQPPHPEGHRLGIPPVESDAPSEGERGPASSALSAFPTSAQALQSPVSPSRRAFSRVAYVDLDVHHGDGVQWIWYDDPRVLTCSIHEDPRFLFPGSGAVDEVGPCFTSLNVPLEPLTTGDVWLWAFESAVMPALEAFEPQVVVLQMGADAHFADPLAHLRVSAQDWLSAVQRVMTLGVPIVALGGGGYNLTTVPRMWAAAVLTLAGVPFEDRVPEDLAEEWGMPTFFDPHPPGPRQSGLRAAESAVSWVRQHLLPRIPRP